MSLAGEGAQRILIVEDDRSIAKVLQDNLLFEGFEVECVGDGRAALDRVSRFLPHMVLLDIAVPGPDGYAVCEA
ncbi:MAG TPA: response regulator, partial [Vicinamibacterales bacterium]|nr:response regulator [Vicinamibacterales bacterium]